MSTRGGATRRWGQLTSRYGLLGLAVIFIVTFSLLLPDTFPTKATALAILDAQAIIALMALAETMVVVVGEFDLSVGYLIGLCHILAIGLIVRSNMPWPLAVVVVLCVGLGVGVINGLLVHVAKIDSFIATLGIGTICFSAANWYSGSQQVTGSLPRGFINLYAAKVFGIPASAIYVIGLLIALWVLLEYTPTGRYLYALGGNRRAAELAGIPPRRYIVGAFAISGLIVGFAGIVLASRLQIGDVGNGPDFLLPTFVGAMLGSTTIKPGRANPGGTIVAVLALGIGIAGFEQLGGNSYFVVPLFNGLTLVVGVGFAGYAARRIRRVRRSVITSPEGIPDGGTRWQRLRTALEDRSHAEKTDRSSAPASPPKGPPQGGLPNVTNDDQGHELTSQNSDDRRERKT